MPFSCVKSCSSVTITAFSLDLLAVLPVEAEAEDVAEGAAPPYERPAMDIPAAYKEQAAAQAQGIWKPAQPQAATALPETWWTVYGDAVLDRLQQQAEANSPTLAQSAARLRAAQAAVTSSGAAALPTVGANASSSRARSGTQLSSQGDGSTTARISTSHSLGLTASWELDLWGRVSVGVSAAQASAQASADDLAAARLSLQAAVAQTYFSLRAAEAQACPRRVSTFGLPSAS